MSPQACTALSDAVTRRLLEAAEADCNRGTARAHREDTAPAAEDIFVSDWMMTPAARQKSSAPTSSGFPSSHPMDAMTVELDRVLRCDAEFDHLH